MSKPLLQVLGLSKSYDNLKVLDHITFTLQRGEILGLVGRRGSGKTTLLHLLGGVSRPSGGAIRLEGRAVRFATPDQAHRDGVELVPQGPQIVEQLNVLQNIFLGREICRPRHIGLPNWRKMCAIALELLKDFDLSPDFLSESVGNLTDEQRHLIALMRAFSQPSKLLLIDDMLSSLSFHRQQLLLKTIRRKAEDGVGVIICSEDIKHLFQTTDRILVLYNGQLSADWRTEDCTPKDVVERMVGTNNRERVTPVIWALENYHKAQQQTKELFRLQAELHESLEVSDTLNRQLVEKLSQQVKAMDRLNLALQDTQRRLLTEREEERKALARELHDSVIQDLLSVNYRLEDLEGAGNDKTPPGHRHELRDIRRSIRDVVGDLRQVCRDLRPPTIDNHGLSSAIPSFVREWEERTGIVVHLEIDSALGRLPELIELSAFRIIQEALNNVSKHAHAQNVYLLLQRTPANDLLIRVSDDGWGFKVPKNLAELSAQKHFGLIGISERAALLGGNMHIESSREKGLTLHVEIPLPSPFP
ncbi:MAG: ATP-binding cassette domain-containing protein [Chloroflexi bacterium]|nr:ATP-binding cassette domain-containing protein [Chloroflexota bacterium]